MLKNATHRSMHQGEDSRLRGGSLPSARERKHLALCINTQDEGKRYHRYCSHSGGSGVLKVERNRSRKSEDEGSNSAHCREQQQHLETKAVVIQRAWRASQSRRESWLDQNQTQTGLYLEQEPPGTPGTLKTPVMSSEDYSLDELKSFQGDFKHVNDGGFQLQSNQSTMDLDNVNGPSPPMETKVLIIQRAWRDFLQRQEVEKRSPSPPSLSSSDKMSTSISMTTLSVGSTPRACAHLLGSCT
ncbi:unnamed protein product [Gadus morhua 'NCC']